MHALNTVHIVCTVIYYYTYTMHCTHFQCSYLFNFFNLLVQTSDHVVCTIRYFLHHHQTDKWVYFTWQDLVEGVTVVSEGYSQVGRHLTHLYTFVEIDHEFSVRMHLK